MDATRGGADRVRDPVHRAAAAEIRRGLFPGASAMDRRDRGAGARQTGRARRYSLHLLRDTAEAIADGLVPPPLPARALLARESARADRPDQGAHPALDSQVYPTERRAHAAPVAPHPAANELASLVMLAAT